MKLYAITAGDYSDYHIVALTSDYKKALKIVRIMKKEAESRDPDYEIEEYEDGFVDEFLRRSDEGKSIYSVMYDAQHKRICNVADEGCGFYVNATIKHAGVQSMFITEVKAKSKEEATKIAADRFAKYFAEKLGL